MSKNYTFTMIVNSDEKCHLVFGYHKEELTGRVAKAYFIKGGAKNKTISFKLSKAYPIITIAKAVPNTLHMKISANNEYECEFVENSTLGTASHVCELGEKGFVEIIATKED